MKSYTAVRVILGVTLMIVFTLSGAGQLPMPRGHLDTLYPPVNLTCTQVECLLMLHWDQPQLPGGGTPPGLIGYNVYRDNAFIHYLPHPDSTIFYFYFLEPLTMHAFYVTAKYETAPGVSSESVAAGPVYCMNPCILPVPFEEDWSSGTFMMNMWQFLPQQANWTIVTNEGNPAPSAAFTGNPTIQNYGPVLASYAASAIPFVCAKVWLDFDYKLVDATASSTEELAVLFKLNDEWFPLILLHNQGSTGWIHRHVEIPLVPGHLYHIGFKAQGPLSSNITAWYIDNIKVGPVCNGPTQCGIDPLPQGARLHWQPPGCDSLQSLMGYDIYRTDSSGKPPFTKINASFVTVQEYTDQYPSTYSSWHFRYLIYAVQWDWNQNTILCSEPCDTLEYSHPTGIGNTTRAEVSITPQPADKILEIKTPWPLSEVSLYTVSGVGILRKTIAGVNRLTLDVSGFPPGIYLIRLQHGSVEELQKVVIVH